MSDPETPVRSNIFELPDGEVYIGKTAPFGHQRRIFMDTRDLPGYALFWEQGTGKTKPIVDTVAYQYLLGNIDALLVVAPMGVHLNWVTDELPAHLPSRVSGVTKTHAWRSSASSTKWHDRALNELLNHPGLAVFTIPYESFTTDRAKKFIWSFLKKRKVFYVADESDGIRTPGAKRTISITASAKYAKYRRILNGTPVANEPWDVYSQMKFLDEDFWKPHELDGLPTFKSHFGKWQKVEADPSKGRTRSFDLCVGYRRLDELNTILKTASDRVLKEDVLDLPPKLFSKARFDMSSEQQSHYESLKEEFMTWLGSTNMCSGCGGTGLIGSGEDTSILCEECGGTGTEKGGLVAADLAITRLLRLQQVTCGYLPNELGSEEPFHVFKENPRLDRFMTGALNLPHGCIVWARFTKDINLIVEALTAAKRKVVRYDGQVSEVDRAIAKKKFQDGEAQFFVANPAAISTGITLIQAKTVIYYSNTFSLVKRLQSEDRAHRIGQTSSVHYVDMIANQTVDEGIVQALRDKMDVASQVTGDRLKAWL